MTPSKALLPVTEHRPLNRHQIRELKGYVAMSTQAARFLFYLVPVGLVGGLAWSITRRIPAVQDGLWWLLPPLVLGLWLFRMSPRWTGGSAFRRQVREDIVGGVAAVRRVSIQDAIEIEEGGDEGPSYFLLTREGQTLHVAFQDLVRYKGRGFPWTEFEFIEAPRSGVFFSIHKIGEKFPPSAIRPPLPWEEARRLGFNKRYQLLDADFASLKEQAGGAKADRGPVLG